MPHYRITRPERYGLGTPGHTKPSGRQGYYTDADSAEDAVAKMRKRWTMPDDAGGMLHAVDEALDVQLLDEGDVKHGMVVLRAPRVERK